MSGDSARDAYVLELTALSKDELDKRLAKYGVKPLPKGQAVSFLTTVHLMSFKKNSTARGNPSGNSAKKVTKKSRKAASERNIVEMHGPCGATCGRNPVEMHGPCGATCGRNPVEMHGPGGATCQPEPSTSREMDSSGIQGGERIGKSKKTTKKVEILKRISVASDSGKDLRRNAGDDSVMVIHSDLSTVESSGVGRRNNSSFPVVKKGKKKISSRKDYKVKLLGSSSEEEESDASEIDLADADSSRPKEGNLKKLVTSEEVRETLTKYIRDRPTLYDRILQYETIYLKPFVKQLKDDGILVKTDLLMDFFDSQTICFSQHNAEKPRQWGGKKRISESRSPKKKKEGN